jgi:phosphate uptake regulator
MIRGLRKKDQVVIEERGDILVIKPMRSHETGVRERVAVIEAGVDPESTSRRVIAAYIMGYDKITVKGGINASTRNAVRETVIRKLPGVEIISESDNEITMLALLDHRSIPLNTAAERLVRAASSMLKDACIALREVNAELAREIIREDDSIDRAYFYVIRLINYMAMGFCEIPPEITLIDLLTYRSMSKLVERIGDHSANIARNVLELSETREEYSKASHICFLAHSIFEKASSAFSSKNPLVVDDLASDISDLKAREKVLLEQASTTLTPREFVALKMILESTRRIAEYSLDIAEIALDLAIGTIVEKS